MASCGGRSRQNAGVRDVSLGARLFVGGFLALFALCGVVGIEAWPLTGWRLFSEVRRPTQVGWQAVTVDTAGGERAVPFERMPRGFSGALHVMGRLPSAPATEQRAVCRAWAAEVERLGAPAPAAVRVYRTVFSVRDGSLRSRDLRVECVL